LLLALVAIVAVTARNYEQVKGYTFEEYVVEFEKTYESVGEQDLARHVFNRNLAAIVAHNEDESNSWKKGVNQFTDRSPAQMKAFFGYDKAMARGRRAARAQAPEVHIDPHATLPDSVDWRGKNIISPVKNQGGCGSCWAFAATESIESAVAQATGMPPPVLSTQNIVSCALNPHHCGGTGGCGGATAEIGFEYTADKGISSEAAYPYQGITGTCKELAKTARIKGFVQLQENNYTQVVTTVANVGPVAINIDANSWGSYSSGVFTGCQFRDIDINHVVQVVGYGTDASKGRDYWIVRNSWGARWGEQGYMRLERHSDGDMSKWCGPDTRPSDGTGCDGGPAVVTACGSCGTWYDVSYPTGGSLV